MFPIFASPVSPFTYFVPFGVGMASDLLTLTLTSATDARLLRLVVLRTPRLTLLLPGLVLVRLDLSGPFDAAPPISANTH